jgi:hypothetical protein
MDQFCAVKDETYRRCACSSRLDGLREMARKVQQTSGQLQSFADYNIDAISKTAKEVAASLTATAGESTALADKSESAQKLAGISAVLSGTKSQALSTAGKLDIAGDISAIWATQEFIGGADIASMEGEKLYSQVHGQCLDMVAAVCQRDATLNMVVSAYGMYIEQDCNIVQASIEGNKTAAAAAVRQAGYEMDLARLENYNAHNSTEINQCIAQVRKDITGDGACGKDYVHCLDMTGLYLDYNTGAPIYSPDFFKLESQTTLDGNFMNSNTNRLLIAMLEEKKPTAARGLDTCRDVANDVWEEFKRQAVIEIYQAQQLKVKQVRDECLSAVNQCYDEKIGQLRNFANIEDQMIIGQSVGTAEALCNEKLSACANVFGGGPPGLQSLLAFVHDVGSGKISENCEESLDSYIHEVCAVTNDLDHTYPYSCRVRDPGSYTSISSGSVYDLLVRYARENCVRTDYSADLPLPSNIMESVNKVFDDVFFEMRILLKAECERYSGEWLDQGTESNIELYVQLVAASNGWGVCSEPYCIFQGDAYIDSNGIKQCCGQNQIANAQGDGCELVHCPTNASIDTMMCRSPTSIHVLTEGMTPIVGGCIGRTGIGGGNNASSCKCNSGYYSVPAGSALPVDNVDADGTCWPVCAANSSWDTTCRGRGTTGGEEECVAQYCRCNQGYKFVAGVGALQPGTGGGFAPGRAATSPVSVSARTRPVVIARTGEEIGGGDQQLPEIRPSSDSCVIACPANSHNDATCQDFGAQINCPNGGMVLEPGCVSVGCRCNLGYCVNGRGVCSQQ